MIKTILSKVLLAVAVTLAVLLFAKPVLALAEVLLVTAITEKFVLAGEGDDGSTVALSGLIEVENLGYRKSVEVIWYTDRGLVIYTPATYLSATTPGRELWSFQLSGQVAKFAVSLAVNGRTYIDDNRGNFYALQSGTADAILTYPLIINIDLHGKSKFDSDKSLLTSYILAQPKEENKTISSIYTDNGWKTTKIAKAQYLYTFPSGPELWRFEAPIISTVSSKEIEFAIKYENDTFSAWDNNYNNNYRISNTNSISRK